MNDKNKVIADQLLQNRAKDEEFWYWLKPYRSPSIKDANKFLLTSILDYQMRAEVAWENARRLAEDVFGDPDNLWHRITSVSLEEWNKKRQEYSLHRFPKGHERVWTIGKRIVQQYGGDARNIWKHQSIEAASYRFFDLGAGEQISRMIVGALIDTGQISGKGDVKVDIHVRRVLGRILQGNEFSDNETNTVIGITRQMNPENPWLLDRPLYLLGKQICVANDPQCVNCYMRTYCEFAKSTISV
jgi:endonuclease III